MFAQNTVNTLCHLNVHHFIFRLVETKPYMTKNDDSVQVWVIEDNDLYRNNLATLLNQSDGIICEGAFRTCEEALQRLDDSFAPDVFLIDIGLPGISGIEGTRKLKATWPGSQIIMITVFDDDEKIFEAICAGASGYLLKNSPDEKIVEAIKETLQGGAPMSAQIARKVLDMFSALVLPKEESVLTHREKEILGLVVEGFPKKQIADRLNVSYHTVDSHIKNIYAKLHVHNTSSAVAKALKEKLI